MTKQKSIVKRIHNDLYGINIIIAIGNYKECNKKLKRIYKIDDILSKVYNGKAIMLKSSRGMAHFIIWVDCTDKKDNNNIGTIAHESYHTVDNICKHIGDKSDPSNNEHRAYLMGYLVNKCLEVSDELEKKNNKK